MKLVPEIQHDSWNTDPAQGDLEFDEIGDTVHVVVRGVYDANGKPATRRLVVSTEQFRKMLRSLD